MSKEPLSEAGSSQNPAPSCCPGLCSGGRWGGARAADLLVGTSLCGGSVQRPLWSLEPRSEAGHLFSEVLSSALCLGVATFPTGSPRTRGEPPVPKVCSAGASFLWSPGQRQPVLDFFLRALPPGTRRVRNVCDMLARSSPARLSGAASAHPDAALTWEQRAVGQQGGSSGGSGPLAGVA